MELLPAAVNLYFAARGHICYLCIYYKNYIVNQTVDVPPTVSFPCSARQPLHNFLYGTEP
jgi:hypothetical protein